MTREARAWPQATACCVTSAVGSEHTVARVTEGVFASPSLSHTVSASVVRRPARLITLKLLLKFYGSRCSKSCWRILKWVDG